MKDRLEDFIHQHREAFDVHEPDPALWSRMHPGEEAKGRTRHLNWLRYAAAIAVIFAGFSAGIYYLAGAGRDVDPAYSEIYRELAESESYYRQLVDDRYRELKPYLSAMPEIHQDLQTDFRELDEIYAELRSDLRDNVDNPGVIEAMIQNYRIKLEILEELLYQIKEKKYENDNENEEVTL